MEFEKMCDLDNQGYYTLVFPNKYSLQMEEIEAFFSQFEGYNDVRSAGTETGLRFPRFKTPEGARRAFDALADHPTISLIPYVNRKKNINNQENRNNKENVGVNNGLSSTWRIGSPRIWDAGKQVLKENSSNQEASPKLFNGYAAKPTVSSVAMRLLKYKKYPAPCEQAKIDEMNNSSSEEEIQCNVLNEVCDNNGNNVAVSVVENKVSDEVDEVATASKVNELTNGLGEESNSQDSEIYDENDAEIPGLLLRASEVVVGNVHPVYGPACLLHLFDKYEPLAISKVKSINNRQIHYCHVYFTSQEAASQVEKQFDKYTLMGRKLLVLQPKTLLGSTLN